MSFIEHNAEPPSLFQLLGKLHFVVGCYDYSVALNQVFKPQSSVANVGECLDLSWFDVSIIISSIPEFNERSRTYRCISSHQLWIAENGVRDYDHIHYRDRLTG